MLYYGTSTINALEDEPMVLAPLSWRLHGGRLRVVSLDPKVVAKSNDPPPLYFFASPLGFGRFGRSIHPLWLIRFWQPTPSRWRSG